MRIATIGHTLFSVLLFAVLSSRGLLADWRMPVSNLKGISAVALRIDPFFRIEADPTWPADFFEAAIRGVGLRVVPNDEKASVLLRVHRINPRHRPQIFSLSDGSEIAILDIGVYRRHGRGRIVKIWESQTVYHFVAPSSEFESKDEIAGILRSIARSFGSDWRVANPKKKSRR